jgi:hypothetical protein
MQLHIGADHGRSELGISSCASTAATNVLRYVVDLTSIIISLHKWLEKVCSTFSQFLSATIGPPVALVSAPNTMPSLKRQPTMVVPVLVAFGTGIPFSERKAFLDEFEKSKPGVEYTEVIVASQANINPRTRMPPLEPSTSKHTAHCPQATVLIVHPSNSSNGQLEKPPIKYRGPQYWPVR